jgi:hypothetical protein
MYPPDVIAFQQYSVQALANSQHATAQTFQQLSRHKGALLETTVQGMDRNCAPAAATVGSQEMSGAAADDHSMVNRITNPQHDKQQVRSEPSFCSVALVLVRHSSAWHRRKYLHKEALHGKAVSTGFCCVLYLKDLYRTVRDG